MAKLYGVSLDELVNGIPLENMDETAELCEAPVQEDFSEQPIEQAEEFSAEAEREETDSEAQSGESDNRSKKDVHISWKDGVHVQKEDRTVHISWKDGVHAEDQEDSVHIGPDGITIDNATVEKYADCHHKKKKRGFPSGISPIAVTVLFLYFGFVHGAWHPAWLLFLLIPIVECLPAAFRARSFSVFPFPVLAALVFLCLGFFRGLWHPGWLVFLLIPVYYPVANWLDREINGEDYESY